MNPKQKELVDKTSVILNKDTSYMNLQDIIEELVKVIEYANTN